MSLAKKVAKDQGEIAVESSGGIGPGFLVSPSLSRCVCLAVNSPLKPDEQAKKYLSTTYDPYMIWDEVRRDDRSLASFC